MPCVTTAGSSTPSEEPPLQQELAIGPLHLGGLIDRAVAVARRRFRPLFLAMLVLQAPALALARLASARTPGLVLAGTDPALAAARAPALLATAGGLLVLLLLLQGMALTITAALLAPTLAPGGEGLSPARGWAGRLLSGAATALLQQLLLALAAGLGLLPGLLLALAGRSAATALAGAVAAGLGALALFLVVLLRTLLAPVAVAAEGLGPWGALRRSIGLMAPRPGQPWLERPGLRASLLLFTSFALLLAVNGLAGLPRALAGALAGGQPLPFLPGALPLPVELGLSLLELAASAALQPFSLAVIVVFYFERRARTEGLDLALWAARLEAAR
jgi:hypothetical protein